MIRKVVKKQALNAYQSIGEDIAYWLSKTIDERLAAVEYLRKQHHGSSARLQRTVRVIQQARG